jgi:hypothetical protein
MLTIAYTTAGTWGPVLFPLRTDREYLVALGAFAGRTNACATMMTKEPSLWSGRCASTRERRLRAPISSRAFLGPGSSHRGLPVSTRLPRHRGVACHGVGSRSEPTIEYAIAAGVGVIGLSIMFPVMMGVVPRTVDPEIALALSANGGTLGSDASSNWRVV